MLKRVAGMVLLLFGVFWCFAVLGHRVWLSPFVFVLYAALWRRVRRSGDKPADQPAEAVRRDV